MAKGGGRRLCRILRVVADSIEKSVVALRQLLTEVWSGFGGQKLQHYLRRRKASTRWMSDAVTNPRDAVEDKRSFCRIWALPPGGTTLVVYTSGCQLQVF